MASSPEFEADIRFLSRDEGGRKHPAVQGMYRPDVHWDDDASETLWIIHPRFLSETGEELADGTEIPQVCKAQFYLISMKVRDLLRQQWLHQGARFHVSEGRHRVAAGVVTKVFCSVDAEV
jgi:translation elongation factor EF-Tu-like GTPase